MPPSSATPDNPPTAAEPVPPVLIYTAEIVQPPSTPLDKRSLPVWMFYILCSVCEWLFGAATLLVGLAVLAGIPVLQFLSLGYLLEASGRVARNRRLRDGFIGVRTAARVGSIALGTFLMFLPLWFISDLWYSAHVIQAGSGLTTGWRVAQIVMTVLIVAHIVAVWFCGGLLRQFFWPLLAPFLMAAWLARVVVSSNLMRPVFDATLGAVSPRLVQDICNYKPLTDWLVPAILLKGLLSGRIYSLARDGVWDFVVSLRLPYYFWLGLRGFLGAMAWLIVPLLLLIGATELPLPIPLKILSGLLGALMLTGVLLVLPFLQTHFAAQRRASAMLEVGKVLRAFFRSPIAFWLALLITLVFAAPLYLLKIAYTPQQLTWLPSLAFVAMIFPARLLTGWAVGRGMDAERPRNLALSILFSMFSATAALPVAALFVLIVFLTRYTSWYGPWSLLEQHAFLVPAPFLGL